LHRWNAVQPYIKWPTGHRINAHDARSRHIAQDLHSRHATTREIREVILFLFL
jgi:hypothetical protein